MLDIVWGYHRMQFQRKRMIQTQENDKKTHFGLIYARWAQIWSIHHFLFKILALQVDRYHSQLSLCPISGKSNDPILRKVSYRRTNGWTDRWTDRQIDGNDFIDRCRASSVQ